MKLRRQREGVPGLNTTSTADISFMLLVFFLVTTSMYVDKGLSRQLPPKDKDKKEQKQMTVDKENMLAVKLDSAGNITLNDSVVQVKDLKSHFEDFIIARGKKHIITIDADPQCKYDAYFHLQNALGDAYAEARETIARKDYGKPLGELTSIDREKVMDECPQRVAENFHDKDVTPVAEKGGLK